jgi:serine/threonine protein kinase
LKGRHRGFVIGKYRLLDRIGVGGMGQVYLAEHIEMGRRAAIKVLPPNLAENAFARERFLREARAVGRLDHPNLVRAFDVDAEGDVVFLVMEYVEGVNLHELVIRHGPLTPSQAGHYLWQAANGLAVIHAAGLIHRDIKPANLMLDKSGTVKIMDLGLVRSEDDSNELTRGQGVKFLGTADFLAPEQAVNCSTVDGRADIYSLGATGYFLLTGKMPYEGDSIAQKLIAHQTKPVPRVVDVRPSVPAVLSDTLTRMMAKNPDDRPQTPGEVMDLLAPWSETATPWPTSDLGARTLSPELGRPSTGPARKRPSPSGSLRPISPPNTPTVSPKPAPVERPPILPAARTHAWTGETDPNARPLVVNPFHPSTLAKPAATRPGPVRKFAVAVGVGMIVAIGIWDVLQLTGTIKGSIVPSETIRLSKSPG